jgi:manganese/iron transport system permease protein/iron/zinc/copper transport system permease protein
MIVLSCAIGIATAFLGMYASFYFNSASGATIVLFGAATVGITYLYSLLRRIFHTHTHGELRHAHVHIHAETHQHEHEH